MEFFFLMLLAIKYVVKLVVSSWLINPDSLSHSEFVSSQQWPTAWGYVWQLPRGVVIYMHCSALTFTINNRSGIVLLFTRSLMLYYSSNGKELLRLGEAVWAKTIQHQSSTVHVQRSLKSCVCVWQLWTCSQTAYSTFIFLAYCVKY